MRYTREGNTVAIRLFRGEELIESVKSVCKKEKITSGRIQAIGAVEKAILGYFDIKEKKYIHFECSGELVSCMGNIAKKEGEEDDIIVHAHAVVADMKGNCRGGHVVTAETSVTLEVLIESGPSLTRALDAEMGLYLLDL